MNGRAMGQGGWTYAGSANCGSSALDVTISLFFHPDLFSCPSLGRVLDHNSWSILLSSRFSFL